MFEIKKNSRRILADRVGLLCDFIRFLWGLLVITVRTIQHDVQSIIGLVSGH